MLEVLLVDHVYLTFVLTFLSISPCQGVGDRIHLSNPQLETNIDGSSGWIVEKVSLYTTSLYWVWLRIMSQLFDVFESYRVEFCSNPISIAML